MITLWDVLNIFRGGAQNIINIFLRGFKATLRKKVEPKGSTLESLWKTVPLWRVELSFIP